MLPDVQIPEQTIEIARCIFVVIQAHHIDEQTLAESARTDEYLCPGLPFNLFDIHGLVHIVQATLPDRSEIGHSVRYLTNLFHKYTVCQNSKLTQNLAILRGKCP